MEVFLNGKSPKCTNINHALCRSVVDDAAKKLPLFVKLHCVGCYANEFQYGKFYNSSEHDLCVKSDIEKFGIFVTQYRVLGYYLDLDVIMMKFLEYLPDAILQSPEFPPFIYEKIFLEGKLQNPSFIQDLFHEYKVQREEDTIYVAIF